MSEDQWYKPTSRVRNYVGIVFFVAAFAWMAVFYMYVSSTYPRTTPDILIVWLGVVITAFLFFAGICIGFEIKTRQAVTAFLMLIIWSLLFLIPIPEGYGEYVMTGYFFLLCGVVILYARYRGLQRKKMQLHKETETE